MNVKWAVCLVTGLASCAVSTDGRYAGLLTTQQGLCGTAEDSHGQSPASLSLSGKVAQFEPEDGVVILEGHVDSAGHVIAQSNAPGADHKPFLEVFEGDVTGGHVLGHFATPRCRADVTLTRR